MDNPERENIGNKTQNKTNKQTKQKHHTIGNIVRQRPLEPG
jgi:hypothetical protein